MKFLTVQQFADLLQVNKQSVYRWIRLKKIGTTRFGRREIRFSEAQIDAFLRTENAGKPEESIWITDDDSS